MKRSTFLTSVFAIPTAIKSLASKDSPIKPVKEIERDPDVHLYLDDQKMAIVTQKDQKPHCPFYMDMHGNLHLEGNLKVDSLDKDGNKI